MAVGKARPPLGWGGGGALKGSLGRGVPQRPSIPEPVQDKIKSVHFATLFKTRDLFS